MPNTPRFEVIPSVHWARDDGLQASIYGACPWTSDAERERWNKVQAGFTIRDNKNNTVGGYASLPYNASFAEASDTMAKLNRLHKVENS